MDIVLHVGMNKTATTTLQEEVFPRIPDFHSIGFKNPGEDPNSSLSIAVKQVASDDYMPGALRQRLEARAGDKPLLHSEERYTSTLWHDTWEQMTRTADRLASELPEARVVIAVRDPADLLVSSYAQYVREGGTSSWRTFLRHADMRTYDVANVCRLYEERFRSVHVLLYEEMRDLDVFSERLVDALGSSVSPADVASWLRSYHNIGMSPVFAYAEIAINRAIRVSRFNPSPIFPSLSPHFEPLRQRLRWANRKFNARSWRVNRRLSERRRLAAELATRGFVYPPRSARRAYSQLA